MSQGREEVVVGSTTLVQYLSILYVQAALVDHAVIQLYVKGTAPQYLCINRSGNVSTTNNGNDDHSEWCLPILCTFYCHHDWLSYYVSLSSYFSILFCSLFS